MSLSSYSVGNRVYNGASNAPTRGTVDPMGYVERSLNNPQQSQSRSGLAAAALKRLQPAQTSPLTPQPGATGSYLRIHPNSAAQTGPNPAQPALNNGLEASPLAPARPPVAVTDTGKLRPANLTAAKGGTGLPFDAEAADSQMMLQLSKNRFESDATAEQQRIEKEYVKQRRDTEEQQPDDIRQLLENYAGRGLAHSSGYAYDQADQQRMYAKMLSQLDEGKTDGIAELLRQRGLFNNEFSTRLQAIQAAAARRAAEQAGDLGLGEEEGGTDDGSLQGIIDAITGTEGGGGQAPVGQVPGGAPVTAPGAPSPGAPAPVTPPRQVLNDPSKPASHTNPILRPGDAPTPSMGLGPQNPDWVAMQPGTRGTWSTGNGLTPSGANNPAPVGTPLQGSWSGGGGLNPQGMPNLAVAPEPAPISHDRDMTSFDSKSRSLLSLGGSIRGGNGMTYKFDPISGRVVAGG